MRKYLNFSNIFLAINVIIITSLAIVYSSLTTWIIWASSILGIMSSMFATKGKWASFVFDILSYGFYIYICLISIYYGELILSCIIIVLHILSLFEWRSHQKDSVVLIRTIKKKEILLSSLISLVIVIAYAVGLHFLGSNYPLLNAFATVVYLLGNYFALRRSILQFVCWILYEIFFISLWILSAISGDLSGIIFLVGGVSEMVYGIIGIINWKKIQKAQNEESSQEKVAQN